VVFNCINEIQYATLSKFVSSLVETKPCTILNETRSGGPIHAMLPKLKNYYVGKKIPFWPPLTTALIYASLF
jgi:hypothetical protein